jgi:hypothetical protein
LQIHDISESTYQWELYAGGAKQVGKRIYALDQTCEGDARVILMWLFYHDALSKFTARHWLRKTDNLQKCGEDDQIRKAALLSGDVTEVVHVTNKIRWKETNAPQIMDTVGCSAEVLELIARACDLALGSHDPARSSSEHIEALDYVERKLTHAKQKLDQNTESHNSSPSVDYESIAELYRIAGLIYLLRAGRGLSSSTPQVKSVVETGLKIAAGLRTCVRAFPIVVLGCEAHLDEERLIILDLLRRTQICRKFANIDCAQRFIEASWAQDDLRPEEDLDYIKKFDVVMSAGKDLPFFA